MPYWMQEIGWIQVVQQIGTFLEAPMKVISFLGTEDFYLMLMPWLFWCVDSAVGFRVGLMLLLTNGLTSAMKVALHNPRPYWVDARVIPLAHETSFGPPSGHSLNSMGIWGLLAWLMRRRWLTILCGVIIFLVGFSRIYLGVHFFSDVALGWTLGLILLIVFLRLDAPIGKWLSMRSLKELIILSVTSSLALLTLTALPVWLLGDWQVPTGWAELAARADPDTPLNPLDLATAFTISGTWLGTTLGYAVYKRRWTEGIGDGNTVQLAGRYIIGMVGVVVLWYGLGQLFPRHEDVISYGLRYLRYTLVGIWIALLAPLLFRKLRLYSDR